MQKKSTLLERRSDKEWMVFIRLKMFSIYGKLRGWEEGTCY